MLHGVIQRERERERNEEKETWVRVSQMRLENIIKLITTQHLNNSQLKRQIKLLTGFNRQAKYRIFLEPDAT